MGAGGGFCPFAAPAELLLLSFAAAIWAGVGSGMNLHVSLIYFLGGKEPVCWLGFKFDELLTLGRYACDYDSLLLV